VQNLGTHVCLAGPGRLPVSEELEIQGGVVSQETKA